MILTIFILEKWFCWNMWNIPRIFAFALIMFYPFCVWHIYHSQPVFWQIFQAKVLKYLQVYFLQKARILSELVILNLEVWSHASQKKSCFLWGSVAEPLRYWSQGCKAVGSNLVGTTFQMPTVNSAQVAIK